MPAKPHKELETGAKHIPPAFQWVIRNVLVDRITAEVSRAFDAERVDALVLKGPALATWLYPGEVRAYCDSDLMVAPERWPDAVRILEELGFAEYRPWMPKPLSLDPGSTAFSRGAHMVDLHCILPGLDGDPTAIWTSLRASAVPQEIGGSKVHVPDHDSLLLHVALHAAHHANCPDTKALYDLRRAIMGVDEQQWCRALTLARIYEGVPAFAAGLGLLPEGRRLVERLEISGVHVLRYALRGENNVIAEEMRAFFSSEVSLVKKVATVLSEIFPRPEYMRWWSPLARRNTLGLIAAYGWRPIWTLSQAFPALRALWRAQLRDGS